jgi:hypothetical protein
MQTPFFFEVYKNSFKVNLVNWLRNFANTIYRDGQLSFPSIYLLGKFIFQKVLLYKASETKFFLVFSLGKKFSSFPSEDFRRNLERELSAVNKSIKSLKASSLLMPRIFSNQLAL